MFQFKDVSSHNANHVPLSAVRLSKTGPYRVFMASRIPASPQQRTLSRARYAMDMHHPPNHKSIYYAIQIPSRRMGSY